jgi:hypothetical protein
LALLSPALCAQAAWTRQYPTQAPPRRIELACSADATPGAVLLFGGRQNQAPGYLNDFWRWDGTTWTQLSAGPSPRSGAAMALDEGRQRVVLFGGETTNGITFADTWEWNGSTWSSRAPAAPPSARRYASLAYDPVRQVILLFGGRPTNGYELGDLWQWNGATWSAVPFANGPSGRMGAAMCFDPTSRRMLLFGGAGSQIAQILDDTWTWDGTAWQVQHPATPPWPRVGHHMVADTARRRVVLFGGLTYDPFTWEWNGSQWSARMVVGPAPRGDTVLAYDALHRAVVLHGSEASDDTWHYATPTPADFVSFGTGCAGSAGIPALTAPAGLPWLGDAFTTRVAPVAANSAGALFVTGFTALPGIDLTPIGLFGCSGFVSVDRIDIVGAANGQADWNATVPNDAAIVGLHVHQQAIVDDPAGPLGAAVSNAVTVTPGIR